MLYNNIRSFFYHIAAAAFDNYQNKKLGVIPCLWLCVCVLYLMRGNRIWSQWQLNKREIRNFLVGIITEGKNIIYSKQYRKRNFDCVIFSLFKITHTLSLTHQISLVVSFLLNLSLRRRDSQCCFFHYVVLFSKIARLLFYRFFFFFFWGSEPKLFFSRAKTNVNFK